MKTADRRNPLKIIILLLISVCLLLTSCSDTENRADESIPNELLEMEEEEFIDEDPEPGDYTYYIKVNYLANVVTIYIKDEDGNYTTPYKAMICSCGTATPTEGTYQLKELGKWYWLHLQGDVYGQYCTQIVGNILFHSVPYQENKNKGSLEWWEFDKLGTSASRGCVRLQVIDAKWIFDNKDYIESVEFYASEDPGPLGKPSAPCISDSAYPNWDPTDPDPENPWKNLTENYW